MVIRENFHNNLENLKDIEKQTLADRVKEQEEIKKIKERIESLEKKNIKLEEENKILKEENAIQKYQINKYKQNIKNLDSCN